MTSLRPGDRYSRGTDRAPSRGPGHRPAPASPWPWGAVLHTVYRPLGAVEVRAPWKVEGFPSRKRCYFTSVTSRPWLLTDVTFQRAPEPGVGESRACPAHPLCDSTVVGVATSQPRSRPGTPCQPGLPPGTRGGQCSSRQVTQGG